MSVPERRVEVDEEILVLPGEGRVDTAVIDVLVSRLRADPALDAVGALDPVVDAVKAVAGDGRVVEAVERSRLGHLGRPVAVRRRALDPATGEPRPERVGLM